MSNADTAPLNDDLAGLLASVPETAPVDTADIVFEGAGVEFGGFVAKPAGGEADALLPGVLIISDWTGLNDHARVRAEMLARLGYVALAGDIYGGGEEVSGARASGLAGQYYADVPEFRARLGANLDRLRAEPGVDPERVAVMGYCFGGSGALELARSGADIAGAVSFHGRLDTQLPAEPGALTAALLVLTGAADPVVPDETVVAFENELREADAPDWQITSYSGAMDAFTIPGTDAPDHGAQFQAVANARSWSAMRSFFDEIFA